MDYDFNKKYYFCSSCKRVFQSHQNLLFVEDEYPRGFCNETCIEQYFHPWVTLFETIEQDLRERLSLKNENCQSLLNSPRFLKDLLKAPQEIWMQQNDFNEKIYSLISPFKEDSGKIFYCACLCLFYQRKPSFIFLVTASNSSSFIDKFRIGVKMEKLNSMLLAPQKIKDSETYELVEHKKSFLFSEIIKLRSSSDIPLNDFGNYEQYLKKTMEVPDEIYSYEDEIGDKFVVYIKSFEQGTDVFYYFVICLDFTNGVKIKNDQVIPIIFLPSRDAKIYQMFSKGNQLFGVLKS